MDASTSSAEPSFRLLTLPEIQEDLLMTMFRTGDIPENFDREIASLSTNVERVDEMYKYLKIHLDNKCEDQVKKSDETATKLRCDGDTMFGTGRHEDAIRNYTKSIAFAETPEVMAMALSKRSAVLYMWNFGPQCITDIDRALARNYPEELKPALMRRRENAEKLKPRLEKAHEEVPCIADDSRNAKMRSASKCITMKNSQTFGRHIVATRNIEIGEVLIVEDARITSVFDGDCFHCHACCKICYNPMPCPQCTQVLYCSDHCMSRAETYHKYECMIRRKAERSSLKVRDFLAIKLTLCMRDEWAAVEHYKVPDEEYRSDRFKEIYNLSKHINHFSSDILLKIVYKAAYAFHVLKYHTDFFDVPDPQKAEEIFKDLLVTNRAITDCNSFVIKEMVNLHDHTFDPEDFAVGIFPVLSLFNHSCCHNVGSVQYGTTTVLHAIRTIKKGEQCYINYGVRFDIHGKDLRDVVLSNTYNFRCNCIACVEDWPLFVKTELYGRRNNFANSILSAYNIDWLKSKYEKVKNQLKEGEKKVPSEAFNVAFLTFEFYLRMLGNIRPGPALMKK